jgi:hypothetical protein
MAVNADTVETYDNRVIREDLREQYYMISPEETPLQQMAGSATAEATYHEWPILALADPVANNRVIEGDDAPGVDAGTLATRVGNYTQISDKQVSVSHTSDAVDAAAENIQRLSKQVALKMRELKRDMETMLLSNVAASAGASGTARVSAGLPAWIRSNTTAGATGTDPTLSDTNNGFPDAAAGAGTPATFTEAQLNASIQQSWEAGGNPTIAMVNATNKRIISETFTGTSTRFKNANDKQLVNAIDIYTSDFGEVTIVPNRFQPALNPPTNSSFNVFLLDPDYIEIAFLETMRQKPLAETGHSRKRLIWAEYTLCVLNEEALAIIRDTDQVFPTP